MFIEKLLNQGNAPLLEQVVKFSSLRHRLIAENIANVDTPGYRQKDLSVRRFHRLLSDRVEQRGGAPVGAVRFGDIAHEVQNPQAGILFHDGNNRSMEELATDLAKNAMMHNLAVELLRRQYQSMENALKERVA
jgi:flagellar basal-body rod protein FlgB